MPGASPAPRASLFQYTKSPRGASPGELSFGSPRNHQQSFDDLDSDDSSQEGSGDFQGAAAGKNQRAQHVAHLRAQLAQAQDALSRGEWSGDWRQDLAEVVGVGRAALRDAEAALEGQAGVLRSHSADEDTQMFSSAFTNLAMHAKHYAKTVKEETTKTRNIKAGLAMRRAAHVRELMQRHEQDSPAAERDALPYVSKLSRETEVVIEVGHALERGMHKFPIPVVAGSWRRAIVAALPLLQKLWDGAESSIDEQRAFLSKVLAAISKSPEGERQLEQTLY